jgi:predicted dehydrogenase
MTKIPLHETRNRARRSRRRFLVGTLAAVAAPQIVPASALGKNGQLAPSDRITIGMFGVGNRGSSSLRAMQPLPDHQVVAIADCRRKRALLAQEQVNGFYARRLGKESFKGCEIYNDFRDGLARDDVDAVWGCVPDHWHGVTYSRVIEAGKDLYGEKPVTRWIDQGVKVRDAVRLHGCVFQTGTQQRSSPHFRHACQLARSG